MTTALTATAQPSLGAKFEWASALPATADAAGVAALTFMELHHVFDGDRPRLTASAEKRETFGGPLYYAAFEDIDTTEIRMPRAEGTEAKDFDAAQAALREAAQTRAFGMLKITVPTFF